VATGTRATAVGTRGFEGVLPDDVAVRLARIYSRILAMRKEAQSAQDSDVARSPAVQTVARTHEENAHEASRHQPNTGSGENQGSPRAPSATHSGNRRDESETTRAVLPTVTDTNRSPTTGSDTRQGR
jgi:hypothetical protein